MSDIVVRAEGLGKKYVIGHQSQRQRGPYLTLREAMMRAVKGVQRTTIDTLRGRQLIAGDEIEDFWALKNVDFTVERGDVVGIIGRNGAGKSTLLKVLSRITDPSEGRVTLRGRVASLLEVGTGFHPELSGRENIFLNGAVLGMSRAEVRAKFDEIVAFAEVEKFLDTPVKRYSSGMYVRLAFAVAAHLEPEILVVDEVLAVGDAQFQKKCLAKLEDVAGKQGRTVLFVSHNMDAITRLCRTALLLERGEIVLIDNAKSVVGKFLSTSGIATISSSSTNVNGPFRLRSVRLCNERGFETSRVEWSEKFSVIIEYDVVGDGAGCMIWLAIFDSSDQQILCTADLDSNADLRLHRPAGRYCARANFPDRLLNVGYYTVAVGIQKMAPLEGYYRVQDITFVVTHDVHDGTEEFHSRGGAIKMLIDWALENRETLAG